MHRLYFLTSVVTLCFGAFACGASTSDDDSGEDMGAVTVKQSGEWTLRCTSGPRKGQKVTSEAQPSPRQMLDFCPGGIAKATQKAFGQDGEAIWTIRCDVDRTTDGRAKRIDLDHEPTVEELLAACPRDYADAGPDGSPVDAAAGAAKGQPCQAAGPVACAVGLICLPVTSGSDVPWVCVPVAGRGEPCGFSQGIPIGECASGLSCVWPNELDNAGTCQ